MGLLDVKQLFSKWLRNLRLIHSLDYIRFLISYVLNFKKNEIYKINNPDAIIPPDYILYESFRLSYERYIVGGKKSADFIYQFKQKYFQNLSINMLDWGCGPARILQQLKSAYPNNNYYGTDYNSETIKWCKNSFSDIHFEVNGTTPPIVFKDKKFQFIYGVSILTHMSQENNILWLSELHRILDSNGILLITTQGLIFRDKLSSVEKNLFDNTIVVRGNVKEGHRTYTTFHHPQIFRNIISDKYTVLEHIEGKKESWGLNQDTWILLKI